MSYTFTVIFVAFVVLTHSVINTNELYEAVDASSGDYASNKLDYVLSEVFAIKKKQNDDVMPLKQKPNVVAIVQEKTFIDLYQQGVRAYLANDWGSCIDDLEKALAGYRVYYQATASCRTECDLAVQRERPLFAENVDNLHVFEAMIRKTACMVKCKRLLLPKLADYFFMDKWSRDIFRTRKPYEYLQLCYFKTSNLIGAASATYTALLENPNDGMMVKNLQFYLKKLGDIDNKLMIKDYEQKPFANYYIDGLLAYDAENWQVVIDNMEKSLQQYIHDEDECRAFCEGEFDQGWHADFITSTANHFTFCLRCKSNCSKELALVRGKIYENIFATHYEYLHIAYYKVNNILEACKAAASFELLLPGSEDMTENLIFYRNLPNTDATFFVARNDAKKYFERQRYEYKLLEYISTDFAIALTSPEDETLERKETVYENENDNKDDILLQATKNAYTGHGY